jgi:hypothetical protein
LINNSGTKRRWIPVASNTIKTKAIRRRKARPNRANLKADQKRLKNNLVTLAKCAAEDKH